MNVACIFRGIAHTIAAIRGHKMQKEGQDYTSSTNNSLGVIGLLAKCLLETGCDCCWTSQRFIKSADEKHK